MTAAFDYAQSDIEHALGDVGIVAGDVVFVQSSLGMLGRPDGASNINDLCVMLHAALQNVIGDQGTIVIPTYTYSFCRGAPFDPARTQSTIGPFSEYFRTVNGVKRSIDPIFSVASTGRKTKQIINDLPHDCFGADSVYDRLCDLGAKIVTVGLGIEYATFRHHAEQMADIPPRFLKAFPGVVQDGEVTRSEAWLYYVPALIENCEAAGRGVAEQARAEGVAKCTDLGRNQVWAVEAANYRRFLIDALADDPWCTSKGPAVDVIAAERARAGVTPSDGNGLPPYPVSENGRQAVGDIADRLNLQIHEWRSGTRFGNWVVPENWQLIHASITVDDGRTLNTDGDFSVYGNSAAVEATISGAVLKSHLNRTPRHNTDWSIRENTGVLAAAADDAEIRVEIDATKSVDHLRVARTNGNGNDPATFLCLTGDLDADIEMVRNCPSTYIYVLPEPLAAIPVIHDLQQAHGSTPRQVICSGATGAWDEVRSILVANGINMEFETYQNNAGQNSMALKQEHA